MRKSRHCVVILQSNYIPWRGYFDLIAQADTFILYDDVQYTRRDWRNRNRIKTAQGIQWLTIPVEVKGKYNQTIRETRIHDGRWAAAHWKRLQHAYARAPFFRTLRPWLEDLYLGCNSRQLSEVNAHFLKGICQYLQIGTQLLSSHEFELVPGKSERLCQLCRQVGGTEYLSGPAARDYLDPQVFAQAGVAVQWMNYDGYPKYPQLHGPFEPAVSILDLLLMCGPDSPRFLKSLSDETLDRHNSLPIGPLSA
jgi:hypothetical protein